MKQRKCNALSKKLGEDSGLTSITEKMVIIGTDITSMILKLS